MPWERLPESTKAEIAAFRRDTKKARFLVDESMNVEVAAWLRRQGFDAVHVSDVGLAGHPDEDVCVYAWREDRVILTHDADFLNDRRFPPQRNPGVVVLPGAQGGDRTLSAALNRMTRIIGRSRNLWRRTKITVQNDGAWVVATFEEATGHTVTTRYRFRSGRTEVWQD